jgi:hypothetical protein
MTAVGVVRPELVDYQVVHVVLTVLVLEDLLAEFQRPL